MIRVTAAIAALGCAIWAHAAETNASAFTAPVAGRAVLCKLPTRSTCQRFDFKANADLLEPVRKALRADGGYALTLQLDAGTFSLDKGWHLDGTALPSGIRELTIAGAVGKQPTELIGSRTLASLGASVRKPEEGQPIRVGLPVSAMPVLLPAELSRGEQILPGLFDSLGPLELARWPETGWAPFSHEAHSANRISFDTSSTIWQSLQADSDVIALGFFRYGWLAEYLPIAGTSVAARYVELAAAPRFGLHTVGRVRFLNVSLGLTSPRRFRVDSRYAHLMLSPTTREPLQLRLAMLSEPLISIRGGKNWTVKNLQLAESRGHGIVVDDAIDLQLADITIHGIGLSAIKVTGGSRVKIRGCSLEDIGQQAVILDGGDRRTLQPAHHELADCRITRSSQSTLTPSGAIRLLGVGMLARNNVIEDVPQSAVYFDGNEHRIEHNSISRACRDAEDCGAIYAGRDWTFRGNSIVHNDIKDIRAPIASGTAVAIYLDDMLSGTRVERNLIINAGYGVLIGGGRDNVVRSNLFVQTDIPIHLDDRALTWATAAVAADGVMQTRLAAMPTTTRVWREAYPALAALSRPGAAEPSNNQLSANAKIDSGDERYVPRAKPAANLQPVRAITGTPKSLTTPREYREWCGQTHRCLPAIQ